MASTRLNKTINFSGGVDGIVRSSTGLVEFKSVPESVEALMTCNHLPVKSQGLLKNCCSGFSR